MKIEKTKLTEELEDLMEEEYAKEVYNRLKDENIRVELDDRNEKLGYRLRETQTKKVPYTIILGDNEKENKTISYRIFGSKETNTITEKEFIELIKNSEKSKGL